MPGQTQLVYLGESLLCHGVVFGSGARVVENSFGVLFRTLHSSLTSSSSMAGAMTGNPAAVGAANFNDC
jgi:hypothetical protein